MFSKIHCIVILSLKVIICLIFSISIFESIVAICLGMLEIAIEIEDALAIFMLLIILIQVILIGMLRLCLFCTTIHAIFSVGRYCGLAALAVFSLMISNYWERAIS